ncbi:hypothetical protein MAR_010627 [Mya arenaria]|uniref:Uncharacterized protein n=1 Tax=Mya arenaria TaxID=6604 RepID=A0ABY7E6L7_MYAAR|nr:hypothetical protein MAR_010627 [Mya arenaria]
MFMTLGSSSIRSSLVLGPAKMERFAIMGNLYWYQVQGQLLVTGADFCDFVTYYWQETSVIRIFPDRCTMEDNSILSKMCLVFCKVFVD